MTVPDGVTLSSGGELSGIPTEPGTFRYSVKAINSAGYAIAGAFTLVIDEADTPPVFTDINAPDGEVAVAYTFQFKAVGIPDPTFTLKVAGTLPPGITLDPDGTISGTPTANGKFKFIIIATNDAGSVESGTITVLINQDPAFVLQTPPGGTVGAAYSYKFTAIGYPKPVFAVFSGTVPSGLTFNPNGKLSGTPDTAATYHFVISATGNGTTVYTGTLTVVIGSGGGSPTPPVFVLDSPPGGKVNNDYDYFFTATGYPAPQFMFGSGTPPLGLTLTSDGEFYGTPTAAGTYVFTVIAFNSAGSVESPELTVVIDADDGGGGQISTLLPLVQSVKHAMRFDNSVSAILPVSTPVYNQGAESRSFSLEAWVLYIPKPAGDVSDQVILGSSGQVDGLILNGKTVSFIVKFQTASDAVTSFELVNYQKVHIVGVYEVSKIKLYVNGILVDSYNLGDDQLADLLLPNDDNLYTGFNAGAQSVGINSLAVYDKALTPDQIMNHYMTGDVEHSPDEVSAYNDGDILEIFRENSDISNMTLWDSTDDWVQGGFINSVVIDDVLCPMQNVDTGLSLGGVWQTISHLAPADGQNAIYGAVLDWNGLGLSVDVSIDGITWTPAVPGVRLGLIVPGIDPTIIDLMIRVTFDADKDITDTYLNWISATVFETGAFFIKGLRDITMSGLSTSNPDNPPFLSYDNSGVLLTGGTLTITPNTDEEVDGAKTIELWIKQLNAQNVKVNIGGVTFDDPTTGTQYINGDADAGQPNPGEWSIMHLVCNSPVTQNITITHTGLIIARVVLYEDAFTKDQVSEVYGLYTGTTPVIVPDESTVGVTTPDDEATPYNFAWTVTGFG